MSLVQDLSDVKVPNALLYLLLATAILGAGIIVIIAFKPEWVATFDIAKLIVLACSFTSPLLVANTGVLILTDDNVAEEKMVLPIIAGAFLTCVVLGIVILLRIFFGINSHTAICSMLILEALICGYLIFKNRFALKT